ncbi:serine-threonine protein kinase, putative [Entamoeba invadens IP1]|uniref:Serine-threonine protein kinase, putative n=1 Tax=Entamoeba invadens IP1 TaxID=370355 RepID=A0A0A1U371_ENTIV|nr:serine-threonine protein kinase, putative [Entamoeba invadens IP1]ELP88506.1 serine-threonine protein kinase, putative [Entamoeba invadens IP1]|eukprot:XP_004255277.1 serine-threonine protein kinase, putative [Entamoeba invadens IP1]
MLFPFLFSLVYSTTVLVCAPGCSTNVCTANYTCDSVCSPNYENDGSCLHCKWTDPNGNTAEAYLPSGDECVSSTNIVEKTNWAPTNVDSYVLNTPISFTLDQTSPVDYGFCYSRQKYTISKWGSLKSSLLTKKFVNVKIDKIGKSELSVDITNTPITEADPLCFAHTTLFEEDDSFNLQFPVVSPFKDSQSTGDEEFQFTFFVSVKEVESTQITLTITETDTLLLKNLFHVNQSIADEVSKDISKAYVYPLPFESQGQVLFTTCMPTVMMKVLTFTVQFTGPYSILLDTTEKNRFSLLAEYTGELDSSANNGECLQTWNGLPVGSTSSSEKNGVSVRIKGDKTTTRHFAVMSEDSRAQVSIKVKGLCPNDCHENDGNGRCAPSEGGCICEEKYGGDDCHQLCYYYGWQVSNTDGLCYFGTNDCDQYCHCSSGNLVDHLCVSDACANGILGPGVECIYGNEGCMRNCQCEIGEEFSPDGTGLCIHTLCGNGQIDDLYNTENEFVRREECDNGTNCNASCMCNPGFKQNPDSKTNCIEKGLSTGETVGIVVGCVAFFIILVVVFIIVFIFAMQFKKVDISIFKLQQPTYHYYISGAKNVAPSKEGRYIIEPIDLDYGKETEATAIEDTRFETIEVKNKSKNKYMMIIIHTPNCPKYVFHFEPQVAILRPNANYSMISYMTLHATTKIRDMKIPFTLWFSKNRQTLTEIASLLKDKDFENWTPEDNKSIEHLCKNVVRRQYNNFRITTDAASSTHIDLDELNISEKPIAEGAMGKVFIGNYRSVPVAIKQFRWENLDEAEVQELKDSVVAECEMMAKLRNPFIASYMGSVTYLPQVSMVIQFFVLGSLGEYLRSNKEDYVKLPYKLKVRMLYDTSRGMQFLHDNKIVHLDLKPDNLLVNSLDYNSACTLKITDFGTSRFTKKIAKGEDKGLGTPIYAAPETYKDIYSYAGDVYSFAITAWEVFYQEEPYKDFKSLFEIKTFVSEGKRLKIDGTMPRLYTQLIENCWKQDHTKRPTFDIVSNNLVKIDDDILKSVQSLVNLDLGYSQEKIETLINNRTQRMQKQLNDISRD